MIAANDHLVFGEDDGFVAAESGHVLFGFDDINTGAALDQTNGPNHGTWDLPNAVYDAELSSNGLRATAGEMGEIEIALGEGMPIANVIKQAQLCGSTSEAMRMVDQGDS